MPHCAPSPTSFAGPHPFFSLLSDLNHVTSDPSHPLSSFLSQHGINLSSNEQNSEDEGFKPVTDVFDIEEAFVVHIELPGALKEDVGINYDYESSTLTISGVLHRPSLSEKVDGETQQKSLIRAERKVGLFTRKVVFGESKKVKVDAEGISARLEAGVLEVWVPKVRVEVKKEEGKRVVVE